MRVPNQASDSSVLLDSEYEHSQSTSFQNTSDLLINTDLWNFVEGRDDDLLASLNVLGNSLYKSGGEDTGVFIRWEQKKLKLKSLWMM